MSTKKLLALTSAVVLSFAAVACGDDDNGGGDMQPDGGAPPVVDPDAAPPGPTTFPAYVSDLCLTKTADNTAPDLEAVWGALPDDETYVFPATFFP